MKARQFGVFVLVVVFPALAAPTAAQQAPPAGPFVRENATVQVSPHVYVIPDFDMGGVPNVGIIAGNRATLVIDTGMGVRNGQTVLKEAERVGRIAELYLAMTHFHPEHDLGAGAFPASTKVIRSQDQQKDIAEFGLTLANQFARSSPVQAELLRGAEFRRADVSFDNEHQLDLGGVRVRMLAVGPTHTRGDTAFFVEDEGVLFAGDVVMSAFPALNPAAADPTSSVRAWLAALDRLDALKPKIIVPAHRRMGDATMIATYRDYFRMLQGRAAELKRQGKSAEETAQVLQTEISAKYPNMQGPNQIGEAVRVAYREAPE